MQLFVKSQQTHAFELTGAETVLDVKTKLEAIECIPSEEQVIFLGGKPLCDSAILGEHCNDLATLDVEVRILGGKVHGSLARAGKVKGQTPKVDKQESKKKKTGRAKRRMQYNRRFVNVVQTFGRRKGPNSNS